MPADAARAGSAPVPPSGGFNHPVRANIDRLNDALDREKFAAVVARSGQNFTYLTGIAYPGYLARQVDNTESARAVMALWPRRGEPAIIPQ